MVKSSTQKFFYILVFVFFNVMFAYGQSTSLAKQVERLDRGLVAIRATTTRVFVSWRLFAKDPDDIAFNVYRSGVKLNNTPITNATNFEDKNYTTKSCHLVSSK